MVQFDLMITSPPYWNLKDYFKDGQIGQENISTIFRSVEICLDGNIQDFE